ncbi:hypothetical protein ACFL11_01310 [Patescibacteria group bacterium]
MIPIVSISNLVSGFIFGSVTLKVYFSYRRTKDIKMRDFFISFFFLSLTMFLLAMPGLLFTNLKIISLAFAIYPLFNFMSLIFISFIPLRILEWNRIKEVFKNVMIAAAVLITILNIINWGPAVVHFEDPFIYWEDTRGELMNAIIGVAIGIALLLVIIFFIIQGLQSSGYYVRMRAFLLAGGLAGLIGLGLVNFVLGASAQQYITSIVGSLFGVLGGLLMFLGVFYKYKSSSNLK